jgi:hypothetical protein
LICQGDRHGDRWFARKGRLPQVVSVHENCGDDRGPAEAARLWLGMPPKEISPLDSSNWQNCEKHDHVTRLGSAEPRRVFFAPWADTISP